MQKRGGLSTFVIISTAALLFPGAVGGATIQGRVVAADTGMPLPRAAVTLTGGKLRVTRTTSDAQGRYELKDLPAGRYNLSVSKAGYLTLPYGQTRAFQSGQSLELAETDVRDQIDFRLPRAGVITGRVTDDLGEPVPEARISAHRYEFVAGFRRLAPVGRNAQTNDLGEFRLYGLQPGQYYLSATTTYAPTYYPGTVKAAEAQGVVVAGGQEVSNVGIPLLPVRAARVSGTAVDANGGPMSGATVMTLEWQGSAFAGSAAGQVNVDGSFTVTDLAPGEYTIRVSHSSQFGDAQEVASARVIVNGEDLTGLTLIAQKPAAVRGRIVFDMAPPADRSTINVNVLRVQALRASPEESVAIGISTGRVDDEGTFEVRAPAGPTILRLAMPRNDWQLKAVRLNGLDVTDAGLDLQSDQELDGVELVISHLLSDVSGTVTDRGNQPVRDYSVVIFSEDRRQWHFQSRFLTRSRPDETGRFNVKGLPPGTYLAIAVDFLVPGEETDPEFLERALVRATRFSLLEGETRTLDLRLQPSP